MGLFRSRGQTVAAEGDALLAAAANGDDRAAGLVTWYRSEGATDDDIRSWWNLHPTEREAVLADDERTRLALYLHAVDNCGDTDTAAERVARRMPRYGESDKGNSGPDRPLPIVLKDRVNRYVEECMADPGALKAYLEAATSFNAHVRAALSLGGRRAGGGISEKGLARLRTTSATCEFDDLAAMFATEGQILAFGELDPAVQTAIGGRARYQTEVFRGDDQFRREIGMELFTGYLVGRRLLGTIADRRVYSRPGQVEANAEALVRGLEQYVWRPLLDAAGPGLTTFLNWYGNQHCDSGAWLAIPDAELRFQAMGVCLFGGVYIAVAEAELFDL